MIGKSDTPQGLQSLRGMEGVWRGLILTDHFCIIAQGFIPALFLFVYFS